MLGDSYFLLTKLPIKCIEFEGKALDVKEEDACTEVIDLAVRGPDNNIILAVAFETAQRHPQVMFDVYFPGMNRLILQASNLCGLFKMYVRGHSEAYYPVVCPDCFDALNVALS